VCGLLKGQQSLELHMEPSVYGLIIIILIIVIIVIIQRRFSTHSYVRCPPTCPKNAGRGCCVFKAAILHCSLLALLAIPDSSVAAVPDRSIITGQLASADLCARNAFFCIGLLRK
jgi:hypothetical protein